MKRITPFLEIERKLAVLTTQAKREVKVPKLEKLVRLAKEETDRISKTEPELKLEKSRFVSSFKQYLHQKDFNWLLRINITHSEQSRIHHFQMLPLAVTLYSEAALKLAHEGDFDSAGKLYDKAKELLEEAKKKHSDLTSQEINPPTSVVRTTKRALHKAMDLELQGLALLMLASTNPYEKEGKLPDLNPVLDAIKDRSIRMETIHRANVVSTSLLARLNFEISMRRSGL